MRKTLVFMVVLGLSIMSVPAMAIDYSTANSHCQSLASMTKLMAQNRDEGFTQVEVNEALFSALRSEGADDSVYAEDSLVALSQVFEFPYWSPNKEANTIYMSCMDVYAP